jgi:hypothetical protein
VDTSPYSLQPLNYVAYQKRRNNQEGLNVDPLDSSHPLEVHPLEVHPHLEGHHPLEGHHHLKDHWIKADYCCKSLHYQLAASNFD